MRDRPTVLVVGDVMLDVRRVGTVARMSPENPGVPVVRLAETTYVPGGAANVATNVVSLGGRAVLVGAIGDDRNGEGVADHSHSRGVVCRLVKIARRPTTVKERIIADDRQLARLDREATGDIASVRLSHVAVAAVSRASIIVLSDYGKGLLTPALCTAVIAAAKSHSIPVIVDPKCPDWSRYAGAVCLTPNESEWGASGYDWPPDGAHLIVKEGAEGLTLYRRGFAPLHVPAEPVEDPDPIGAGDSAVAALAVAIGRGASWEEAARLANAAGAEACRHAGTVAVRVDATAATR